MTVFESETVEPVVRVWADRDEAVEREICDALNSDPSVCTADDFDVEAIAEAVLELVRVEPGDAPITVQGGPTVTLGLAGWRSTVDADEFWQIAAQHEVIA